MFTRNRDRLLTAEMPRKAMAAILAHREVAPLLSDEHFPVDGTLIEAFAMGLEPWRHHGSPSMKSFQPKAEGPPPDDEGLGDPSAHDATPDDHPDQARPETGRMPRHDHRNRNVEADFKGEKRSNGCHWSAIGPSDNGNRASTPDQEARLYKKSGTGAALCFMGQALENRHGPIVRGDLTQADGPAERKAAPDMIHDHSPGSTRRLTLGADKGHDSADSSVIRQACVTPHVARKARYSAVDGRTTRHDGYALSRKHRKKIEEVFGWARTVGGMARTVYRGVERVRSRFIVTMTASNLARLPKLLGA